MWLLPFLPSMRSRGGTVKLAICPLWMARPGPTARLPPDSAPTMLAHGLCLGLSGGIGLSAVVL
eukprot:4349729-Karenia_brevis.AAC.1